MLRGWIAKRRSADEHRVIVAIGMLRPSRVSVYAISRLAHVPFARTYAALERLETAGRVTAEWSPGPPPRRRIYRVVRAVARG